MRWFWIVAVILLGVAAFAVWGAFQRPDFVAGLIAIAAAAAWKAFAPSLTKRMTPEDEAAWRKRYLDGSKDDPR